MNDNEVGITKRIYYSTDNTKYIVVPHDASDKYIAAIVAERVALGL